MKKAFYIIGAILLILIITNPGESSLMRVLGEQEFSRAYRKANYLVCSVYSVDFTTPYSNSHKEYFAILGKFYKTD